MTTTTSTTASSTQSAISSTLASAAQSIISGSTKSSLDVSTLVSSLVTAKTTGQTTAIANKTASDNTMLSAVSQIKSALSSLQTSLSGLSDGTALAVYTATTDGKGITATAGTTAMPGSYSVQVVNVASAQKIISGAHQSTDTYGGTLSLSLGSTSMSLSLTGNETLSDIASSINSASGNPGISATIVTVQDGQHLVLASKSTGAANTISVTTGGSVDSSLGYSSTSAGNYTESSKAADADLFIDGTEVTSASNTLTSAINGMTLNLTAASAGTTQNLTVAADMAAETTSITNFVNAYNSFVSQAAALSSFDSTVAAGSKGGVLLGDSMLQSIRSTLSTIIMSGISTSGSSTTNLASIGVNLQNDSTTLANSLSTNATKVNQLFNKVNGIGTQLGDKIDNFLASGGIIDSRTSALNADLKSLTTQTTTLQTYMPIR